MAKKQTRRSISVNRKLYDLAKGQAARKGISLSAMTEQGLIVHMAQDAHPQLGPILDKIINETRAAEQAKKAAGART